MGATFGFSNLRMTLFACLAGFLLGGCETYLYAPNGRPDGLLQQEWRFEFSGTDFVIDDAESRDALVAAVVDQLGRAEFEVTNVTYMYDGLVQTIPERAVRWNELVVLSFKRSLPEFRMGVRQGAPAEVSCTLHLAKGVDRNGFGELTTNFWTKRLRPANEYGATRTLEQALLETTDEANVAILKALPGGKKFGPDPRMNCGNVNHE